MKLKDKNIGYIFTGSFCTFSKAIEQLKNIVSEGANVIPIMSEHSYFMDTKFGKASDFIEQIKGITGKDTIIHSIQDAEAIGPKKMTDVVVMVPATGNTIAKLANGITDTTATMAMKSHLRNNNPVVLGISTNDALSGSAENIREITE